MLLVARIDLVAGLARDAEHAADLRHRFALEQLGAKAQPSKIWPGERSWVDRLHPFAEFLARGREVADYFYEVHGPDPLPDDDSIIWQCPELYRPLRRAFPAEG